ncbi:MAG: family 78 glycoside hydrolase catalytic domain [Clostridia bacterium]|nr:family 78 glycoside hydrolase catalytic domain [Clostridia bacterium]
MFCKEAKWLGCDKTLSAPVVIKKFSVHSPQNAVIDICGLGYYELFLNGKRVGNEFFKPAVSDYSDRDFSGFAYPLPDRTSHTIYYNTYDITAYLKDGENVLAVLLGNGFYRQKRRHCEGNTWFGEELLLRFDLRVQEDGKTRRIYSDGAETAVQSFITENNLFYGETHDYAAFDFDILQNGKGAEKGVPVRVIAPPKAKLLKQRSENDTVRRVIQPKIVKKTDESVIYDAGENISGFVCLKALSATVRVRHAEELSENGELDFSTSGGTYQISQNTYNNAQGRTVRPWFSWSGFRYFEIFGDVQDVEVWFVCSGVKVTAEFACDNENIQWLYDAFLRSQLSNMHGGVPSDCPHRERLGYTGDGQLGAESTMLLTDSRAFYQKWIRDIADCQDIYSGHVQHTAPFFGGGGGPGGWGGAIVLVPYAYYKVYGDTSVLKKYYPNMLAYLRCMHGFCEDGLVVKEREKGWCLGDWCTLDPVAIPEAFVNTFYYVRCMELVQKISERIGEKADFEGEIEKAKTSINRAYFDHATGDYCGGVQGANAFALLIGLGDQRTKENLLQKYEKLGAFDTGIFGTDILTEYLAKIGEVQLLYKLLSREEYPSFGYMRGQGATTIWEAWQGDGSHNHPMFGGCVKQLFYGLLGITADAGFKNIKLSPRYIDGLGFIRAKLKLPSGTLRIEYRYKEGKVHVKCKTSGKLTIL